MYNKYMDINNIEPKYWGKNGWIFLNCIALTYKPEYKDKYKVFIEQLPYILPCKTCGDNMKNNLNSLDKALNSKQDFINWLINIRNEIYLDNKESFGDNVKQVSLSDTLNEIYTKDNSNMYLMIIISFIIIVLLIVLLIYYRQ